MTIPQRPGCVLVADGHALIVTDRNKINICANSRELLVYDLLSHGWPLKSIAELMGQSPTSVYHARNALKERLGEKEDAGVVMRLLRAGLLT